MFKSSVSLGIDLLDCGMPTEDPFVAALKSLCDREGGYKTVAMRAKISPQNLWQIISGVALPSGNPRGVGPAVRKALNAAFPNWLDGSGSTVISSAVADVGQNVAISEYDTGGRMGRGLVLRDQPGVIRQWVVTPEWVQQNVHRITSPSNLAIVTGFGDSMRALYNPGDPLLIDRGIDRADIDGVYFFRVGEEGFVKRLQRIPTVDGVIVRAKSENTRYDPFDIVKGMDFEVFGRVVKAWRGEDF